MDTRYDERRSEIRIRLLIEFLKRFMSKEIVNKVANSQLINIDLEDFYPEGERVLFDITSIRKFLGYQRKCPMKLIFTVRYSDYPENKSSSKVISFCVIMVTLRTPSLTSLHT